jgi:hypothetical protein
MTRRRAFFKDWRESRWWLRARSRLCRHALLATLLALLFLVPGRGFALDSAKAIHQFNCPLCSIS